MVHGVYDHSDETFFSNIKQVPAGYSLTLTKEGSELKKYWDLDSSQEYIGLGDPDGLAEASERFLSLFY